MTDINCTKHSAASPDFMKILYVGSERRDAQAVATALRGLAQNVALSWARSLDQAARWLEGNEDAAALVIDGAVAVGSCPESLRQLRRLPSRPAVIVVVPEGAQPTSEAVGPPADGYVTRRDTFLGDLPIAVASAVTRVQGAKPASLPAPSRVSEPRQHVTSDSSHDRGRWTNGSGDVSGGEGAAARVDLERQLAGVTAALEDAQRCHAAAMSAALTAHELAASELFDEQRREFDARLATELVERRHLEETLAEAVGAREAADARCAAVEQNLRRREAELVDEIQRERAMRAALEQANVDAHADLHDARQRHEAALTAVTADLAEHQKRFDRGVSQITADRDSLRRQLQEADAAAERARRDHEFASAVVDRLTLREVELVAQLAELQTARQTLEGELAAAVRRVEDANERAARERADADARQADLEGRIAHEIDARRALEHTLEDTRSAARDVERSSREEAEALRARAVESEVRFDSQLASQRLEYETRLADLQHAHDDRAQALATADADVRRLNTDLSAAARALEDARRERQDTVARLSNEHAAALAELSAAVAERDERLKELAVRHDIALRASERARMELRERLQAAHAAHRDEVEQVQRKLVAIVEALETAKSREVISKIEGDRVPEPHQGGGHQAENEPLLRESELALVRSRNKAFVSAG